MPFLRRRKSTLIDGAADDATDLSDHLASYLDGRVAALRLTADGHPSPPTSFLDDRAAFARGSTALRRRPEGAWLCDELLQALGPRSGGPRRTVRTARSRHPMPGHSRTGNEPSSSPPAPRPSATRTARWRGAQGWPTTPAQSVAERVLRGDDDAARQHRAGARPLGPPARPRSERDDSR